MKEGNDLFNGTVNTFYLWIYGIRHMVKNHSDIERKPAATITMAIHGQRKNVYAPQDSVYHSLSYTSHRVQAATRNSSMGPT